MRFFWLLVFLIFFLSLSSIVEFNSIVYAQLQKLEQPPVIITQVELNSPYKLVPENISCSQWNATAKVYSSLCRENIVPNRGVMCTQFIGSAECEPIHIQSDPSTACNISPGYYNNGTAMKDTFHSTGEQWVVLYNRLDTPVSLSGFNIIWYGAWGGISLEAGPTYFMTLSPNQSCTYAFIATNDPLSIDPVNATATVSYSYQDNQYVFSTPPLTDTYHDSGIWQYDGTHWTFTDKQSTVPEFPFAASILVAGIASLLVLFQLKFRIK
jgi:hypothetical protein